jgi:hypothetical protein
MPLYEGWWEARKFEIGIAKLELRNSNLEFGIANWFVSRLGGFTDGGEDG